MKISCIPQLAAFALAASVAQAADVLMVNFSSAAGNDMDATDATALGVDVFQNVRTNVFNTGGSIATISLDGVTGSLNYNDYYQQFQDAELGQPYSTFVGARLITSGPGTGGNQSANISLDLSSWLLVGSYTSYNVTLYYAGRSAGAEDLMTDSTADVHFNDGNVTADDSMTVALHGSTRSAFFGGVGAEHEFTGSTLAITMDYLGGTTSGFQAGIAAIKIEGVPEPSTTVLIGLGSLALIRRRRA